MKVFIFALVLLLVLCLLVVWNSLYINNVETHMRSALEALPDINASDCVARARELLSFWEEHEALVRLSVGFPAVDRVTEQAKLLLSCAEIGDVYGFRSARTLLCDALSDVARLEKLSIFTLL